MNLRQRDSPAGTVLRGFVNIDKPTGITSFDVIRAVRRAAGMRRVGHAGTLDPAATGVLPVALGEATKLVEELLDARKRYRAVVELGVATDTYDADGTVVTRNDASTVTRSQLEAELVRFHGEQWQRPPAYSAVKRGGVPAYKAARAGTPLELEPRRVVTYSVKLISFEQTVEGTPLAIIEVECGRGYYLRTLAHDLGQALGCGAHLRELRRTAVGTFNVDDAVPLTRAEDRLAINDVETLVHAPDVVITGWPTLLVSEKEVTELRLGRDLHARRRWPHRVMPEGRRARCYDPDGRLVALLMATAIPDVWHPYRVLLPEPSYPTKSLEVVKDTTS